MAVLVASVPYPHYRANQGQPGIGLQVMNIISQVPGGSFMNADIVRIRAVIAQQVSPDEISKVGAVAGELEFEGILQEIASL